MKCFFVHSLPGKSWNFQSAMIFSASCLYSSAVIPQLLQASSMFRSIITSCSSFLRVSSSTLLLISFLLLQCVVGYSFGGGGTAILVGVPFELPTILVGVSSHVDVSLTASYTFVWPGTLFTETKPFLSSLETHRHQVFSLICSVSQAERTVYLYPLGIEAMKFHTALSETLSSDERMIAFGTIVKPLSCIVTISLKVRRPATQPPRGGWTCLIDIVCLPW